jgi:RNA ligase (TIGR02306 family)
MRKLATIRKITNIVPIENCDNIALAIVDGWTVIIKKSEFSIGDSCVFFEIDSFLPLEPRYEFLKKTTKFDGKEGYRIKTMKMKGVLSQGLALPLTMFPEVSTNDDDVTNRLNIIKFDLEQFYGANTAGPRERKYGSFPTFIPKTDQPRIQNMTHMFLTHKDTTFEETLKLDGSSMTCYKIPNKPTLFQRVLSFFGKQLPTHKFGVCSRNVDLNPSDNKVQVFDNFGKKSVYAQSDFWATAIKMDIENKLPIGYAIQGELIGPSIQANHEKVSSLDYFVFDVYDINKKQYLTPEARREFCKQHNIQHVPVTNPNATPLQMTLEELLAHVDTESMNPGTVSEGRVYKSNSYPTMSFKVINNKYLLKHEK